MMRTRNKEIKLRKEVGEKYMKAMIFEIQNKKCIR